MQLLPLPPLASHRSTLSSVSEAFVSPWRVMVTVFGVCVSICVVFVSVRVGVPGFGVSACFYVPACVSVY